MLCNKTEDMSTFILEISLFLKWVEIFEEAQGISLLITCHFVPPYIVLKVSVCLFVCLLYNRKGISVLEYVGFQIVGNNVKLVIGNVYRSIKLLFKGCPSLQENIVVMFKGMVSNSCT